LRDHNAEAAALPHFDFDLLMHDYMLKTFQPWLDGVSALELGCFQGAFTSKLAKIYHSVSVVDAAEECIKIAQRRADLRLVAFYRQTFEGVVLDEQFDAIFAIHVLEHLDDPVAVLKRCRDWLNPGGKLFVAVPNADAASRQIAVKMGLMPAATSVTEAERKHGHQRTYCEPMLWMHIKQAGLRPVARGGIMFKALANFQMDAALKAGIIDQKYLDGCYELGKDFPELCGSIFAVCEAS